jgi:HEAT repeat protein
MKHALAIAWLCAFALSLTACSNPVDPTPDPRVAELVEQLESENANDRTSAAVKLMKIGPPAYPAVPALIENLGDEPDPGELAMTMNALLRIGPGSSLSPLIDALSSDNPGLASNAAFAIAGFGRAGRSAIPALMKALEDPEVRRSAAAALEEIQKG